MRHLPGLVEGEHDRRRLTYVCGPGKACLEEFLALVVGNALGWEILDNLKHHRGARGLALEPDRDAEAHAEPGAE